MRLCKQCDNEIECTRARNSLYCVGCSDEKRREQHRANNRKQWLRRTRPHEYRKYVNTTECSYCGVRQRNISKTIEVHHIDSDTHNNNEDNIVALCNVCHNLLHSNIIQLV